jgi:hypothetical protein
MILARRLKNRQNGAYFRLLGGTAAAPDRFVHRKVRFDP